MIYANPTPPIHRLPNETLHQIFCAVVAADPKISVQDHSEQRTWLAVLLACRHWRDVALGSSHLWKHIHVSTSFSASFVHVLICRSKQTPLSISLFHEVDQPLKLQAKHFVELLSECSNRIVHLTIQDTFRAKFSHAIQFISSPAPLLHTLHLTEAIHRFAVFRCQMPLLRQLHIEIHDYQYLVPDILHNLRNFSLLQMLSIHIVGTAMYQGVHPPPSSDPDPTVKLAHLQNLRLVSAFLPEKILRFYASLVLPTTATVDLRFRGGSTNTRYQECGPLMNTIQGIDNATLLLSRACGTVSVHSADGKLRLAWELGNTANNSIAFSAITFPALQRLTVSIPVDPTDPNDRRERRDLPDYNAEWEAEISALLHPTPAVTSLTIDCSLRNRYALFNIIGRKLNSATPFVLPNLSSITISDFDNHTRSAMQLLFCARARAKDGIPLASLEVRMAPGAVFPKDTLARLESAVGTVTVHQDDSTET